MGGFTPPPQESYVFTGPPLGYLPFTAPEDLPPGPWAPPEQPKAKPLEARALSPFEVTDLFDALQAGKSRLVNTLPVSAVADRRLADYSPFTNFPVPFDILNLRDSHWPSFFQHVNQRAWAIHDKFKTTSAQLEASVKAILENGVLKPETIKAEIEKLFFPADSIFRTYFIKIMAEVDQAMAVILRQYKLKGMGMTAREVNDFVLLRAEIVNTFFAPRNPVSFVPVGEAERNLRRDALVGAELNRNAHDPWFWVKLGATFTGAAVIAFFAAPYATVCALLGGFSIGAIGSGIVNHYAATLEAREAANAALANGDAELSARILAGNDTSLIHSGTYLVAGIAGGYLGGSAGIARYNAKLDAGKATGDTSPAVETSQPQTAPPQTAPTPEPNPATNPPSPSNPAPANAPATPAPQENILPIAKARARAQAKSEAQRQAKLEDKTRAEAATKANAKAQAEAKAREEARRNARDRVTPIDQYKGKGQAEPQAPQGGQGSPGSGASGEGSTGGDLSSPSTVMEAGANQCGGGFNGNTALAPDAMLAGAQQTAPALMSVPKATPAPQATPAPKAPTAPATPQTAPTPGTPAPKAPPVPNPAGVLEAPQRVPVAPVPRPFPMWATPWAYPNVPWGDPRRQTNPAPQTPPGPWVFDDSDEIARGPLPLPGTAPARTTPAPSTPGKVSPSQAPPGTQSPRIPLDYPQAPWRIDFPDYSDPPPRSPRPWANPAPPGPPNNPPLAPEPGNPFSPSWAYPTAPWSTPEFQPIPGPWALGAPQPTSPLVAPTTTSPIETRPIGDPNPARMPVSTGPEVIWHGTISVPVPPDASIPSEFLPRDTKEIPVKVIVVALPLPPYDPYTGEALMPGMPSFQEWLNNLNAQIAKAVKGQGHVFSPTDTVAMAGKKEMPSRNGSGSAKKGIVKKEDDKEQAVSLLKPVIDALNDSTSPYYLKLWILIRTLLTGFGSNLINVGGMVADGLKLGPRIALVFVFLPGYAYILQRWNTAYQNMVVRGEGWKDLARDAGMKLVFSVLAKGTYIAAGATPVPQTVGEGLVLDGMILTSAGLGSVGQTPAAVSVGRHRQELEVFASKERDSALKLKDEAKAAGFQKLADEAQRVADRYEEMMKHARARADRAIALISFGSTTGVLLFQNKFEEVGAVVLLAMGLGGFYNLRRAFDPTKELKKLNRGEELPDVTSLEKRVLDATKKKEKRAARKAEKRAEKRRGGQPSQVRLPGGNGSLPSPEEAKLDGDGDEGSSRGVQRMPKQDRVRGHLNRAPRSDLQLIEPSPLNFGVDPGLPSRWVPNQADEFSGDNKFASADGHLPRYVLKMDEMALRNFNDRGNLFDGTQQI